MTISRDLGLDELVGFLCEELRARGVDVVLSGGSCVTLHSGGAYVSLDIDLVETGFATTSKIRRAMRDLGFEPTGRHYTHPDTDYLVEFPAPPPSVGSEPVKEIIEISTPFGRLRALSPTDCVKDRLAAFYHWRDLQSLEQARLVCQACRVDLDEVARWSDVEGMGDRFAEIHARLARDESS